MLLAVSLVVFLSVVSCQEIQGRNEYTPDGWFYRTDASLRQVPTDIPRGAVGIYLNNNNLELIRATDFRGMTALTFIGLHSNFISQIENGAFTDLTMVTELWLTNNNLRGLQNEMFKGLDDLEELLLSDNDIDTIDNFAFAGLSNLRELYLSSNRLNVIRSGMFSGLGSLEELVLTNNSIDTVQSDAFFGLSNLKKLWLDWNRITEVKYDMFRGLTSLERLALHHNRLTSITGGIFTGLFRLEILDLDDNMITMIRSDSFRGLDDLSEVWLYNNSLTSLDAGSFSGLPSPLAISLGANPLRCDSDLCWLKQGYVTWLSFENRGLLPDCSGGMTWNDLYCPVQADECPDPGQVENAKRSGMGPFKVRSKVTYTCDFCYMGSKEITCQSNGQWSELPVCRDVRCPEPGQIQNGRKLSDGPYECSHLVGYECNDGYMMAGNSLLVCRGDATWNTAKPQCVPTASKSNLPTCKSDLTETRWLIIAIAAGVAGLFVAVICTASCMQLCARRRKFKKLKG